MQILQIGTIVKPLTLTAEVTIGPCAFSGHVGVLKRAQDNVAESGQHVKSHPNDASAGKKKVISPERVLVRYAKLSTEWPIKIGQSSRCMILFVFLNCSSSNAFLKSMSVNNSYNGVRYYYSAIFRHGLNTDPLCNYPFIPLDYI